MSDPEWTLAKQFTEYGLGIVAIHIYPLDDRGYFMRPKNYFRLLSYLCAKLSVNVPSGACECRLFGVLNCRMG